MARLTDERLVVYVILRTPYQEESVLKSYLSRLAISLDAYAVNRRQRQSNAGEDGSPAQAKAARDLIYSGTVNEHEDPLIILRGGSHEPDGENQGHVFAVWKLNVFLGR